MRFVVFHKNSESIRWKDGAVIVACATVQSIQLQMDCDFGAHCPESGSSMGIVKITHLKPKLV